MSKTTEPARILVIEDDRDIRETLVEVLEDAGYTVVAANDGVEALDILRNEEVGPALILLDLMMPNMNGLQFREEQLRLPAHSAIPVAVLTADANAKQKAEQLRAAAFLKKPIKVQALLEVIARLLADAEGSA